MIHRGYRYKIKADSMLTFPLYALRHGQIYPEIKLDIVLIVIIGMKKYCVIFFKQAGHAISFINDRLM